MNIVVRVDMKELTNRIAVNLGRMGFSNKLIRKRTGLTECQITYRLHKAGVRRIDYRNGESDVADMVIAGVESATKKRLNEMRVKLRPLLRS